ncbi:DUF4261 domain-containing protein [Bacilliculturomica massiliensis]|uniref:DUF4261 domain-containing protein n=1 Tax=Bacilliculturomica massiliensis TaxID=1917867 RepID=UPI001FE9E9A0|nr:DUF4261 domain-containing protein [Bacilliculturomica massiliensis]
MFGKKMKEKALSAAAEDESQQAAEDRAAGKTPVEEEGRAAGDNGFAHIFWMKLLFDRKPEKPETETVRAALEEKFGAVDVVSGSSELASFAIRKYPVKYSDAEVPAQVMLAEVREFHPESISSMQRSQLWNVPEGPELLDSCTHELMISDFMAAGLDYKERCRMLTEWLDAALELFPECRAVWVPTAEKLLTAQEVRECPAHDGCRFVYVAVNARLFNIEGTEDSVVDTLGLYAVGLPDVQYHYHSLDPNHVVNHAYNAACYIFENDAPIKGGETIDGIGPDGALSRDIQWRCQYEMALVGPERELMDICPGEYAAGGRTL